MTFLQHLEELRQTLLRIVAAVALGAVACSFLSDQALEWLIAKTTKQAIFLKAQGGLMAHVKISIVMGILATLPYIFYKLWSFIGPGLLDQEKRVVLPGVVGSLVLFYAGILFSYFVLTPLMVHVLLSFGTVNMTPQISVHALLNLVFSMGLASGLVFQMPLAGAFLTAIGVVRPHLFLRYWRHSVVVIFIVAAVLTPMDLMSQLVLAVPLLVLYFVSYLVSILVYRAGRKPAEPEDEDPGKDGNAPPAGEAP